MGHRAPTIVVIEDSPEVRSLITTRLRLSRLFEVVGEGSDGTEAIGLAHRHQPSVLLLDMSMPTMDGLEALPAILTVAPSTRVVFYSGFQERDIAARAVELGAAGFIEKSTPIDEVAQRLLDVLPSEESESRLARRPVRSLRLITGAVGGQRKPHPAEDGQGVLDEHLERFREVFDESAIGMATMTLTGSVIRANPALARLMLCRPEDLVGVDYGRLTAGEGDQFDAALAELTEDGGELAQLEHEAGHPDNPRTVLATLAPVRDSTGQPLYIFLQLQDFTAQRVAEDELRRSEERFRLLVEAVREYAIFMLAPDGTVVSWNVGAERIKGYSAEEIIGQHFRVFYGPEQRRSGHPEYVLDAAIRDGQYAEEGWRYRKDGTRFWAFVVITAVHNEHGEHIGFTKVTRDQTGRTDIPPRAGRGRADPTDDEISLHELNAQLRQQTADQSRFLAVAAHELRTPLSVLSGSAQTLATHWEELDPTQRAGLLETIHHSANRMQRLTSDMLTAATLDSHSLQLHQSRTPLAPLLSSAARTHQATHPDAEITVDAAPDIEVFADADRLSQALSNLVGNALWHGMPPVHIAAQAGDGTARITVTDSGTGVDSAVRPRLFERFATGRRDGGTGLGLFIVRELARAHGGDAFYEPESPDRPAGTFVLTIPLA
ncbi:PAS domain S-box protein [Phytoactinopolyspora halotolerans]|uniref:histidine kinase n=1 Tax=Phytoactinopolyspora halotolerans TaxID=1981512 RepID=A0A6L9SHN4_9ACTN|nr:PAS domain S-box protein [Phytoactinopolyspora halotolerans]NEE04637.1 PAS domain S-box protein [Phytoactinopolyspora halotolerans]